MTFGNWIRNKRMAAGVSQGDVAKALDYTSAQYISNYERDVCYPSRKAVTLMAKLYGVDEMEIKKEIVKYKTKELENDWL